MRYVLFITLAAQICLSQSNSKPFLFTAGYRLPASKAMIINSGHGLYVEAGINPAWFVSHKLLVGIFAGWGMRDNLWSTSFNDRFVTDYVSSIDPEKKFSALDSTLISSSKTLFANKKGSEGLNGCNGTSFHNYSLYYGVLLKIPGSSFYLKLYTGSTRSYYRGSTEITNAENNNIQLRRKMYGGEFMWRDPLHFIFKNKKYCRRLMNFGIGMYYEFNDMYTASLFFSDGTQHTGIALTQFMSGTFLSKYRREQVFGFKLSYSVL
jgi:hypothetical protein